MSKQRTSYMRSEYTHRQQDELSKRTGLTYGELIAYAIDRLHTDMRTMDMRYKRHLKDTTIKHSHTLDDDQPCRACGAPTREVYDYGGGRDMIPACRPGHAALAKIADLQQAHDVLFHLTDDKESDT